MEKIRILSNIDFKGYSNNSKPLKPLSKKQFNLFCELLEQAKKPVYDNKRNKTLQLKYLLVTFTIDGKSVYGYKIPIDEIKNRIGIELDRKKGTYFFKVNNPHSKTQCNTFINLNDCVYICSFSELINEIEKRELENNKGIAIEYILQKLKHSVFYHNNPILNGGDLVDGNSECKFFDFRYSGKPSCRLFENIVPELVID